MLSEQNKFVFVGPMGAGKTTAISSISGTQTMTMEVPLPEEMYLHDKTTTTVGFDFGVITLQGYPMYLYGTPGQLHLRDVAGELLTGAVGAVLLVDASTQTVMDDIRAWLGFLSEACPGIPVVVALNRVRCSSPPLKIIKRSSRTWYKDVSAVVTADPRKRMEVSTCLRILTLARIAG